MSSFFYFIKESLKGFTRNLSTALGSIVTIFLSLLIIGVFLVGGFVVEKLVSSVESEVSITAYVSDDASDADIQSVENFIEGLDGVASVGFTNKEQALEKFRSSTTSDIIDTLDGQNPLPRSIDVELSDPQLVEQVADAIRGNATYGQIMGYDTLDQSLKYGQQTVDRLFTLTNYVRYIGIALVALLIFIAMVFINNTIRLAITARRREIAIMRLVGASNGFIRGPFLMEGTLEALIAALLAIAALAAGSNALLGKLSDTLSFLSFDIAQSTVFATYGLLLAIGVVIGLFGSAMAMRRYLKV